jgi:hypothetical protein
MMPAFLVTFFQEKKVTARNYEKILERRNPRLINKQSLISKKNSPDEYHPDCRYYLK